MQDMKSLIPLCNEGGMVMKRWGDSKAFISLINVIFILLAGMAMTGCATTPLITAAHKGQTNVVKDLLDKGADVNERVYGVSPLYWAVLNGHMETVKILVDRGADVNAPNDAGWTPLMVAVYRGQGNIVKLLIERGADIEGALALFKKLERKNDYEFLERLANKYQPPRYGTSPSMVPTALPLPTESVAPF
jgi:hypothetical protein